jgi:hypothetical protein
VQAADADGDARDEVHEHCDARQDADALRHLRAKHNGVDHRRDDCDDEKNRTKNQNSERDDLPEKST